MENILAKIKKRFLDNLYKEAVEECEASSGTVQQTRRVCFDFTIEIDPPRLIVKTENETDFNEKSLLIEETLEIASNEARGESTNLEPDVELQNQESQEEQENSNHQAPLSSLQTEKQKPKKESKPETKKFSCDLCSRSVTFKSRLGRHLKGKRKCLVCEKFFCFGNIIEHYKVHDSNPQGSSCRFCKKTYTRVILLRQHISLVHGRSKYFCDLCEYKSAIKNDIMKHFVRIHIKGSQPRPFYYSNQPFKCECGKTFNKKINLKAHMRRYHRNDAYKKEKCHLQKINNRKIINSSSRLN